MSISIGRRTRVCRKSSSFGAVLCSLGRRRRTHAAQPLSEIKVRNHFLKVPSPPIRRPPVLRRPLSGAVLLPYCGPDSRKTFGSSSELMCGDTSQPSVRKCSALLDRTLSLDSFARDALGRSSLPNVTTHRPMSVSNTDRECERCRSAHNINILYVYISARPGKLPSGLPKCGSHLRVSYDTGRGY